MNNTAYVGLYGFNNDKETQSGYGVPKEFSRITVHYVFFGPDDYHGWVNCVASHEPSKILAKFPRLSMFPSMAQ